MTTDPSRSIQRLASIALVLACGCGVPEEAAAPLPPPAAPLVAPPPAASPPIAFADPPPGGGWEARDGGRSGTGDVFSASDGNFKDLQKAMDGSAASSLSATRRLKERATALGGALAMCHIGGDDASGPIQVVRFDPPTAGFGAADDAWLIFGDALMVVPRAAGSAELLPSWPGATVLTVSWAASTPGEPPRCQVGG